MRESGYYAPGTEFDPNAPWNEPPSCEDVFGGEAQDIITDRIDNFDDDFLDFLADNNVSFDENLYTEDVEERKKALGFVLENENLLDKYYDSRYSGICEDLAEEADEEREAARDAYYDYLYECQRDCED